MKNKIFGGLVLIALASAGIHADAANDGTAVIGQCRAEAMMASPLATESDPLPQYGTVYDDVYPNIARVGQTIFFSIGSEWSYPYTVEMFVSNPKNEDEPLEDTSLFTIVSQTNTAAKIQFNARGIYYVNYLVYDTSGQLVQWFRSYDVYVEN